MKPGILSTIRLLAALTALTGFAMADGRGQHHDRDWREQSSPGAAQATQLGPRRRLRPDAC